MKTTGTSIEIDAPIETVWNLVSVFEHWPLWGPTIKAVDSEAPAVAAGVTGRVKTIAGPWLPFVITEIEPGRSWHWNVAGTTATGHYVSDLGNDRTLLKFTVPSLFALYVLVLRTGLRRLKTLAEETT